MLRREITYTDFNGEEQTDVCYFHLSKPELIELNFSVDGGMGNFLQSIVDARNNHEVVQRFKQFILKAYGEKSDDGRSFVKNDALRDAFESTAAYETLWWELVENEDAAAEFFKEVFPKDLMEMVEDADKPKAPVADTQGV